MKIRKLNISSIKGFRIGNATDKVKGTGCTVIICEKGAIGGVDVRGGGPATRETDLLRSENTVSEVHAVVLSGGSAFGLESASGVMRALADKDVGFKLMDMSIPIVCGASLFDLGTGDKKAFPDVKMGMKAVSNAYGGVFKTGNEGAGTGASVGKIHGMDRAMKTGLGAYACGDDCIQVGAVVAVNAIGDVYSGAGNIIAGLRTKDGGSIYGTIRALKGMVHEYSDSNDPSAAGVMSFTPPKDNKKIPDKERKAMLAEAMEQEFRRTTQFRKEEVEKLFAEMEKEEKKKKEAKKKKLEADKKKKAEAEKKKKAEEAKKKKLEEARKKEEARKIEEEKKKFEAEQKRIAEEKKRRQEEERRRFEEEKKRLEAEEQKRLEEERKKAEKETEEFYLSMLDDLSSHTSAEETAEPHISEEPSEAAYDDGSSPEDEYIEADEAEAEESEVEEAAAEEAEPEVSAEAEAEAGDTESAEETGDGKDEPVLTPVKEKLEADKPAPNDDPVMEIDDPVKVHDEHAAEDTALEIEKLFADADVSIDEPPTEAEDDKMGYDIPFNTTIGCLITNAKLTKAQANKLASILHDAYARAIKPVHSTLDGDTIFVLSSGQQEVNFDAFAALATDVMQYAIIDGANSAKAAYGLPSANDMK